MSPRPPAPLAVPSSPAAVSLGPSKGSLCPNALPAIGRSMDLAATGGGEDVREPDTTRWPAGARGGSGRGANGDVFVVGQVPLLAVTAEEVDRIVGSILELCDHAYLPSVEIGFASSLAAERAWRARVAAEGTQER